MQCNGKCYLAKQMRQIEQEYEQSKQPFPSKNLKPVEFILFFQPAPSSGLLINHSSSLENFRGGLYTDSGTADFQNGCFHPPCFLS